MKIDAKSFLALVTTLEQRGDIVVRTQAVRGGVAASTGSTRVKWWKRETLRDGMAGTAGTPSGFHPFHPFTLSRRKKRQEGETE